jgi:hypothetical protein
MRLTLGSDRSPSPNGHQYQTQTDPGVTLSWLPSTDPPALQSPSNPLDSLVLPEATEMGLR